MTKVGEVYKCMICGNTVKVLNAGVGTLVCCGEPMKLQAKGK
jgi:superoxide reductase